MNEVVMLCGSEPREILRAVIEKKVPATMSYLSKGKWHTARVSLTNLGANRLDIQLIPGRRTSISRNAHKRGTQKPHLINIQLNQPVGISLKYEYGKFIFETTVIGFEPSSGQTSNGGPSLSENSTIVLMVPDRIEIVQRRNFFRVDVPSSLRVNVTMWHRCYTDKKSKTQLIGTQALDACQVPPERYWQGKLVSISVGGVQIVVDAKQKPDFKKGQFLSLRFTPMPYEVPLMLDAQIRNILQTADEKNICLGLQIVGLKASPQGRQVLQRLCNVVEHYYQISQYSTKQQDFQTTSPTPPREARTSLP